MKSPEIMQKSNNVDSICNSNSLRLNPKILVVNGTSLKQCLAKKKKALIYYWAPRCRSQMCFPPEIVQSTCDSKKIELYIVAEYYDSENMKINYNIKRPIYGIDTEYYKTSLTTKYTRKFLFDIDSSLDFSKIKLGDRYLYFENGKFIKSYESVYDVEK